MSPLDVLVWALLAASWALWGARVRRLRARSDEGAERVARACHEIRGPLAAAQMALHAMARRDVAGEATRAIEGELRRAARALDDLQDAPHPDRGPSADDEPVDLVQLARLQVEALRPGAGARAVVLRTTLTHAWTRTDPLRIAQVIANLVANALEHGAGDVVVAVREVGGGYAVEVCDEGAGLDAPLPEIVRRPRAGEGRRGRGLAIATELAERAGGRLRTAPSRAGARLVLELPADALTLPDPHAAL